MIELLTILISLTLAVTGVFLYRDYARFLKGAYIKRSKVVSIQPTFFSSKLSSANQYNTLSHSSSLDQSSQPKTAYVAEGFYPIIEYSLDGEAVRFTSIDHLACAQLHVGDNVQLRFIKTRRKSNRACKTLLALITSIFVLGLTLVATGMNTGISLSLTQIFLGSFVIALSLSILGFYLRDQDQHFLHGLTQTKKGYTQLFLAEPTAFKKWHATFRDPAQRLKIHSSKLCGASFICGSVAILSTSFSQYL